MKIKDHAQLASHWDYKFKEAMVHKDQYTKRWKQYMEAYEGTLFKRKNKKEYHSDVVSNYIFSIIETIRPIMLDNDPKFQVLPRHPEALQFTNDLQEAFMYEWDREKMTPHLYKSLIYTLVLGTSIDFTYWDSSAKEVRNKIVNPYQIFPDPLATSVSDAEYIIYASYHNVNKLKRKFPEHADKLTGANVNYGELVNENDKNGKIDNQVLVLEIWTRDESTYKDEKDGKVKLIYPRGRVLTIANELGLVLKSEHNPYRDNRFPFTLYKDYDIPGKFWGEGEVSQLLSPQLAMSELHNSVVDNAKATANMPWIIDKTAGIPFGSITNEPGAVIRKNPGSELRREAPPSMPPYIIQQIEMMKSDMEQVSGIFDSLKGNSETGVYTAQGILALQEAGQARIRLKVKLLEDSLGDLATLWFNRMQQFWTEERFVRVVRPDGSYELREFPLDSLNHKYDIRITAGSTMPVNRGAMLDLMTRLAQTVMPDGQALVDREAVVTYLPEEVKSAILRRTGERKIELEQQVEMLSQQVQQMDAEDDQIVSTIDQLVGSIEALKKEIVQVTQKVDADSEKRAKDEERSKIQEQAYNSGFADAEKNYQGNTSEEPLSEVTQPQGFDDAILDDLEALSDEELMLMAENNPDLLSMIDQERGQGL